MQICISPHTGNHASIPPLSFLQACCPFCHPTNSVKALKAKIEVTVAVVFWHPSQLSAMSKEVKNCYISATIWPILMIYTSYDMFLRKDVPFGVGFKPLKKTNLGAMSRRFQAKHAKYSNFCINKITAAIPTNFCSHIHTSWYCLWVFRGSIVDTAAYLGVKKVYCCNLLKFCSVIHMKSWNLQIVKNPRWWKAAMKMVAILSANYNWWKIDCWTCLLYCFSGHLCVGYWSFEV